MRSRSGSVASAAVWWWWSAWSSRATASDSFLGLYAYDASSDVEDAASIDLDQRTVAGRLAVHTDEATEEARALYRDGAFSAPYAVLRVATALRADVAAGTSVVGNDSGGGETRGAVLRDAAAGDDALLVRYSARGLDGAPSAVCSVGANPKPILDGCFASAGHLTVGETQQYNYSYDPRMENKNDRTLNSFSTSMVEKEIECGESCDHLPTLQKYLDYYGPPDYGSEFVEAAFDGRVADLAKGAPDFGHFDMSGKGAAVQVGTLVLNVWMYVVTSVEEAAAGCRTCADCNGDQIRSLDQALAIYTGSVHDVSLDGGHMLFSLAEEHCRKFDTCDGYNGLAGVNSGVFEHFGKIKEVLEKGWCPDAAEHVDRVRSLTTVLLVQGVLRAAYEMNRLNDRNGDTQGRAAAFGAALQPLVDVCNQSSAIMVDMHLAPGSVTSSSFDVVKHALERNYECLGVTCREVGGLVLPGGVGYRDGAAPCGVVDSAKDVVDEMDEEQPTVSTSTSSVSSKGGLGTGATVGIVVGGLAVVFVAFVAVRRFRFGVEKALDMSPTSLEINDKDKEIL